MLTILTVSPLAFWLTRDTIDGLSESVARRQNKAATERRNDAEKALAQFSSITASRYGVAQTGSGGVAPMLFLPCPDNLRDNNLDGAADAPCGADAGGNNLTNGALGGGSRFGRFPWRVRVTAEFGGGSVSRFDFGFGADLRDAYGNRAWYAISKNIASHKPAAAPLYNFHHLHWRDKSRWLSLYDARGLLADDVAAVVLFPGRPLGDQIRDPIYENARATITAAVSAAAYFESTTTRISATVWATISNADNDGRFVVAPAAADFNDEIALLRLSEMTAPSSPHYDAYIGLVGAPRDKTHNAPVAGSLLAGFAREVEDFYRAFRYYPHPAIDAVALAIENGLAGDCGSVPNSISIHAIGFWPDQEYPAMTLITSGRKIIADVDLRGGFLHRGVLFENETPSNTITVFPGDDIIVRSSNYFRVEAYVDRLSERDLFDKIVVISNDESFTATMTTTLTNVRTDARTYREAGFFLHAAVPDSTMTVVQYPWRSGESSSRVGQTKSPPCPDRRNFISERIADFTRNHPLIYAAAATVGDGLIVEIAPDARVALPTAQTLTNTFTFTLRAGQISLSAPIDVEVRISGGAVTFSQPSIPNAITLLTDVDVFPVPAAMVTIRNLRAPSFFPTVRAQARIRLPKNLVLTEGENLIVPRGAIARGGADSKFVGVRALVIWSPAPLAWADCQPPKMTGANSPARVNQIQIESATGSTVRVTRQRESGENATYRDLCHWLDDSENADEDGVFRISSIDEAGRDAHPRNDYFLLFGGVFSP